MPLTEEMKKLLEKRGIVGVSDPGQQIRIYVETEEDLLKLPSEISIAGVSREVEPIVSGRIFALQRTSRMRPAYAGISIGHFMITAGTLGCILKDKTTGKRVILSNNHILAASNQGNIGDHIYQPGPYDSGTEADTIATLLKFVQIKKPPETNIVDAACALPLSDDLVSDEILDVGRITGIAKATVNLKVKKSGRTTGLTRSTIFDTSATIKVYGYPFPEKYAIFEDQLITMPAMASGGDSGSALLTEDNKLVGLLFAGSTELTAFNKIENVCNLLNIDFAPTPPPPREASIPALLLSTALGTLILGSIKR
jgi:hypothetical protein